MNKKKVLGIIPARLGSTRFPEKILFKIKGKSLIEWVWKGASEAKELDELLIATDSPKVMEEIEKFGGKGILTSSHHQSGTDRLGEVSEKFPEFDILINIQGDEPLIKGELIDKIAIPLKENPEINMVSAYQKIKSDNQLSNPNIVKVILNSKNEAIYFSRFPIPFARNKYEGHYFKHIGIYGYQKDILKKLISLTPPPLEKAESLEQLRALYYGFNILMLETDLYLQGIDTKEDIEKVEKFL